MEFLTDPTAWASLATLTLMEIVLGIDNIIFISIIAGRLPKSEQGRARLIGLIIAAVTRFGLLAAIAWLARLTNELFSILGHGFSGRDLILLGGGLFLIYKATKEIHAKLEGEEQAEGEAQAKVSFSGVITQIVLLDIIFSLDSVITAIGMASHLVIMMTAVVLALAVMIWLGKSISDFVMQHPTVKMLALSFLLLIGVTLLAESFHTAIPKGYIYSAMAFSIAVEMLNLAAKRRRERKRGITDPVQLKKNVVGVNVGGGPPASSPPH